MSGFYVTVAEPTLNVPHFRISYAEPQDTVTYLYLIRGKS